MFSTATLPTWQILRLQSGTAQLAEQDSRLLSQAVPPACRIPKFQTRAAAVSLLSQVAQPAYRILKIQMQAAEARLLAPAAPTVRRNLKIQIPVGASQAALPVRQMLKLQTR